MITICGKKLSESSEKGARDKLEAYMHRLARLTENKDLSSRIRFIVSAGGGGLGGRVACARKQWGGGGQLGGQGRWERGVTGEGHLVWCSLHCTVGVSNALQQPHLLACTWYSCTAVQ